MPIIKYIAIHRSPMKFIKYIMNGEKTNEQLFVTGLNCTADEEYAYSEFKDVFEYYSGERFYKPGENIEPREGKERIRLHHYIQAFSPGEVTPELAHEIGVEWAKKVFGKDHQVLVSTHIDKGSIHNHLAVASYDLNGKIWYGNLSSLRKCREISDEIAKKHGLGIIEKPDRRKRHSYAEWLAQKNHRSWKAKLCDTIDRLVLSENVRSVYDLLDELRKIGYIIKVGKYVTIRPEKPSNCRAVRTYRLGDGYDMSELAYRIEHKNRELSMEKVMSYTGIQREYAFCLRELQLMVYRKAENPNKVTYGTLRRNTELLTYICDNNIHSRADFESHVNSAAEKADSIRKRRDELLKKIELEEKIIAEAPEFVELIDKDFPNAKERKRIAALRYLFQFNITSADDISEHIRILDKLKSELAEDEDSLKTAESEKREAVYFYSTWLDQMQSDYDVIFEKLRQEKQEQEIIEETKAQEEYQEEKHTDHSRKYYSR